MSYTNAIFYVDDGTVSGTPGSDAARTTITSVLFSNPSGTTVRGNKTAHGLITGAVITISGTTNWNGDWKITRIDADNFDLVDASWTSGADNTGDVVPFGGSSWADAWLTNRRGNAFLGYGDGTEVRFARSPPPVSIGNATWRSGPRESGFDIASSTNASPIVVTSSDDHPLFNGDWVFVQQHTGNASANGVWKVANVTSTTFELVGSTGVGVGSGGTARSVSSSIVELAAPLTLEVADCNNSSDWTVTSGMITVQNLDILDGGTGYTVDDLVTIDAGDGNAVLKVTQVSGGGAVEEFHMVDYGTGYSISASETTTGGTGSDLEFGILALSATSVSDSEIFKEGRGSLLVNQFVGSAEDEVPYVPLAVLQISATDFSDHNQLTFQVAPFGFDLAEDSWEICLCSDTDGATVVDRFKIPPITLFGASTVLRPMTVPRVGGGVLGSSIQSILIRASPVPGAGATVGIILDNIQACTDGSLNLQSLITKNAGEQSGSEPTLTISFIKGVAVGLDLVPSRSFADGGIGVYYGTSGVSTTYVREGIKFYYGISPGAQYWMALLDTTYGSTYTSDGTDKIIKYTGGWNISTGLRTGKTLYDGLACEISGLRCSQQTVVQVLGFGIFRAKTGFDSRSDSSSVRCDWALTDVVSCNEGILVSGYNCSITCPSINMCGDHGVVVTGSRHLQIYSTRSVGSSDYGFNLGEGCVKCTLKDVESYANEGGSIVSTGEENVIQGLVSKDNNGPTFLVFSGSLTLIRQDQSDIVDNGELFFSKFSRTNASVRMHNYDSSGYHRTVGDASSITSMATDRPGGSGPMWALKLEAPYAFFRDVGYPLDLNVAEVSVSAGTPLSFKAWMRKDHATNVVGRLFCRGGQYGGPAEDQYVLLASDTSWAELELVITPTEDCVLEFDVQAFAAVQSPGTPTVYVDDISASQGD